MISKGNNVQIFLLNITFCLIPISFVLGNSLINFNIVIILLYSLLLFRLEVFKINLTKIDVLILIFFTYVLINGILNNFLNFKFPDSPDPNIVIKKSFLYLRFLLLYLVIRFLILKNFINFKYLFISFGFCSLLVSADVIIQFFLGVDVFGYESTDRRLSGPFGEEKIAGSFVQRFFIFLPYFLILFSKFNNKFYLNSILFLIFITIAFGTLLSGNRIPLILLMISLLILLVFEKNFRKILLAIFFIFIASFIYLTIDQKNERSFHFQKFVKNSSQIVKYLKNRIKSDKIVGFDEKCKNVDIADHNKGLMIECSKYLNVYIKEIESGILTWEENKNFGGGIKSFRWNCNNIDRSKMLYFVTKKGKVNCNNHPHNYYLQIAAELGFWGLSITALIIISILTKGILYFKNSNSNEYNFKILMPFFIVFVLEVFPLKTTGSFFTTANATFLFIILSFVVGLINKDKIT